MLRRAVTGAALAALVAAGAYRLRALSRDGAVTAFAVGAVVFGSGGWPAAAVLLGFFVPSSLLSRVGRSRKRALRGDTDESARDAWQVLANGGVAALAALAMPRSRRFGAAFAGAFAAACADTWGTEIGTLSRRPPVSILTLRPLQAGRSGGVTALGTAATVGGGLCVAGVAALTKIAPFWCVALGGIGGALLDSVLGASLQALRWCPACAQECETVRHDCGGTTQLLRGAGWLQNDGVNFAATLGGAIVAAACAPR